MSIIGNPIITTNYISDSFSGDASTVAFTLSQAPASAASIAVYISGLYQIPTSAYSISGTTLTFTGAPPTGTNNITVLHLGVKSATLVPVNGSVTPQMLSNANVVYWSASNNNIGIGNVTPTSLLTVTGTAALGNTTITGFANVTSTIQGGAGLTIAGAASGITTLATGNTTITGFANISSDAYIGGSVGIGITSYSGYKLSVGASKTNVGFELYSSGSGSQGGYLNFRPSLTAGNEYNCSISAYDHSSDTNTDGISINGYDGVSICTGSNTRQERMRIDSNGYGIIGSNNSTGDYGTSPGIFAAAGNTGWNSGHVMKAYSLNTGFSEGGGGISFIGCRRSNSSAYVMLGIYSGNDGNSIAADREFLVRGDGQVYADGSFNGGGADYAEYFEWADSNSNNEDRRGFSVVLVGDKIRKATSQDSPDLIIGVVSANPSVVGDAQYDKWKDKYVRDEFGDYIRDPHNVVEWTDNDGKHYIYREGSVPEDVDVPPNATTSSVDSNGNQYEHRRLNVDYDPNIPYVPREDRPEWDAIGLMGKLRIRKGQPIGTRWIKMRDVSETVEEWLVR